MLALIQLLSISLDLDKFQITRKAQTHHSGSFCPGIGYLVTGSNHVSKRIFVLMYGYVRNMCNCNGWVIRGCAIIPTPCLAELFQLYFSSFEAGIANAISSFK